MLNGTAWRTAEVPAVNGHGTARAVAGLYVALEQGLLLTEDLRARATAPAGTGPDLVLGGEREHGGSGSRSTPTATGWAGSAGGFGWWSETGRYAIAFLTGHIGDHDRGDRIENARATSWRCRRCDPRPAV